MYDEIFNQAKSAAKQLIDSAKLKSGDVMVIGCSSSEVAGEKIGTYSSTDVANAVFGGIYQVLKAEGIFLAAQCCEHLNRAIIIEKELADRKMLDVVNVVPQPKAGGSFATAAYNSFENAVAVEHIKADAGIDIGGTLIGMHLKEVAVPVRIDVKTIGQANILCARTRPKFIGGSRANYDDNLM
ncbi:MAG: TIGR01440 family protein [Clostridia bacterium]|nr:TIGR01440 family protein [Clostridia bacterium]